MPMKPAGLSGRPVDGCLDAKSSDCCQLNSKGRMPIQCGGGRYSAGSDAVTSSKAGASLGADLTSGFIYRGPELVAECVDGVPRTARDWCYAAATEQGLRNERPPHGGGRWALKARRFRERPWENRLAGELTLPRASRLSRCHAQKCR